MKLLHVAAELFPYVKTGGLGDVMAALPQALSRAGADVRLMLPGYPAIMAAFVQEQAAAFGPMFGASSVSLRVGHVAGSELSTYVIDAPQLYDRPGGPYQDADEQDWPDNLRRFALLGWMAGHLGGASDAPGWAPEVVHAHDWHAALACAYLSAQPSKRAASVFTVHNMAFQGLFPLADGKALMLPAQYFDTSGMEFYGQLSCMKAGLVFADRVTTVSPTYAQEIATAPWGCGLEGVIRGRGHDVCGILNGIDMQVWDPRSDTALPAAYGPQALQGKAQCKRALQEQLGLQLKPRAPMFCVVSRLSEQKGLDLLLEALPAILDAQGQLVVQGVGVFALEQAWRSAAAAHPGRLAVRIEYNEVLAHRVIGAADVIVVPSRYEPCGLTQLYGLRYGTLPLVHGVGGLVDTVIDADSAVEPQSATGFIFRSDSPDELRSAIRRAATVYADETAWQAMMRSAMAQDYSWAASAQRYLKVYEEALGRAVATPRGVSLSP